MSHLYNLRRSKTWTQRTTFEHTRPTAARIGERRRPTPDGRPGHMRVDTVHQGDRNGAKGVSHVNLVDEVTQFEHVGAVAAISEAFLVPVLEEMLLALPFAVLGFHADNGSEYVNHQVAAMLNKLHVPNFTKSRARRSNDNALVEGKNASVVRKWFGRDHIPQRFAAEVNDFSRSVLSPYLNHHHPCLFATEVRDCRGKVRRRYRRQDVATPYDRLKSLTDAERFLKPGVTSPTLTGLPARYPISRRTGRPTTPATNCSDPSDRWLRRLHERPMRPARGSARRQVPSRPPRARLQPRTAVACPMAWALARRTCASKRALAPSPRASPSPSRRKPGRAPACRKLPDLASPAGQSYDLSLQTVRKPAVSLRERSPPSGSLSYLITVSPAPRKRATTWGICSDLLVPNRSFPSQPQR